MFVLYEVFLYLAFIVATPYFLLTGFLRGKYLSNLGLRLGRYHGAPAEHDVWIHAVSVGEVLAAKPIVERLLARRPSCTIVITTTTITGQSLAQRSFPMASVTYFPFDFTFAVKRFLDHHRPATLVVVETEIWPNVTRLASQRGLKLLLVNGRISDRSFARYRAVRSLLAPILGRYSGILARDAQDRRRFIAIGAPEDRVEVCGNVKFDFAPESRVLSFRGEMLRLAKNRPLFVAGSTMEGEDETIIQYLPEFVREVGCFVVLAPRRPERFEIVAALLQVAGARFVRRSELSSESLKDAAAAVDEVDVLLLDSIGDLASVYQQATAAFVGGSLVPSGGHNPIEPIAAGAPVAFGPHMSNFREIATTFLEDGAAVEVKEVAELVAFTREMVLNPERRSQIVEHGKATIENNKGAADRVASRIVELLDESPASHR